VSREWEGYPHSSSSCTASRSSSNCSSTPFALAPRRIASRSNFFHRIVNTPRASFKCLLRSVSVTGSVISPSQAGIALHTPRDPPGQFLRRQVWVLLFFCQADYIQCELVCLKCKIQASSRTHRSPDPDLVGIKLADSLVYFVLLDH